MPERYCSGFKLRHLVVRGCEEFLSTAILPSHLLPYLGNLEKLEVGRCNSVEAIFEVKDTPTNLLIPLKELILAYLPNLRNVWSKDPEGKLSHPDLSVVKIKECKSIKFLLPESVAKGNIEWLLTVQDCVELVEIVAGNKEAKEVANKQVSMNFFHKLSKLILWNLPNLKCIYHGIQEAEFSLSNALFPSCLLPFLHKLKWLLVGEKCGSFETIFDVKDAPKNNEQDTTAIPLKTLSLKYVPNLRKVWNKDPKGSISLPYLEEVVVNECKSITSLFSESVAKCNLKKLEVKYCEELVEIVTKDETSATDETNKELIMFPKLISLTLQYLPSLTHIYGGGLKIINWPELKELKIYGPNSIDSAVKVVTPLLKRLSMDKEGVILLEKEVFHLGHENINYLELQGFNDIESDAFPLDVFSKVPLSNVEEFAVSNSAFKEIFPSEKPEIIPSKLIRLVLRNLHKLESIGLEHSWTVLSFSSMTRLKVEDCPSLKYLLTSSTAKSLVNLQELYISNCEALQSVVAYQPQDDVIIFEGLEKLSLNKLPKLESFYTPNSTLNFPCLKDVIVTECNRLEYLFSSSTAESSRRSLEKMTVSKCESLETVVLAEAPYESLIFVCLNELSLSELPKLKSFFSGNSALAIISRLYGFQVSISQCKSMKTFSHGALEVTNLWKVEIDGVRCSNDNLNATVTQQFENQMKQH